MARRYPEVRVLNPSRNTTSMKRMNPDNLMSGAKDVGMEALLAVPAAVLVGGAAVAANKITYNVAAGDMFTPDQKRAMLVGAGALVAGVLMQLSNKTANFGQLLGALGVGVPLTLVAKDKIGAAMMPAAATQPLVAAPSSGLMPMRSTSYLPAGFPSDFYSYVPGSMTSGELTSSLSSPSWVPPAR